MKMLCSPPAVRLAAARGAQPGSVMMSQAYHGKCFLSCWMCGSQEMLSTPETLREFGDTDKQQYIHVEHIV